MFSPCQIHFTSITPYLYTKLILVLLVIVLSHISDVESVVQGQKGLAANKERCDNGQLNKDRCECARGWTGQYCDRCSGRVMLNASSPHSITDGQGNYTSSSRCLWIIYGEAGPVTFSLNTFATECCWDHVYIYDGDSVNNDIVAVLSGSQAGREIQVPSSQAMVYFVSDLAYDLEGFSIGFDWNKCPNNCSGNGNCTNGRCHCNSSHKGEYCEIPFCPEDSVDVGPCVHGACENGACACPKNFHGASCETLIGDAVVDSVFVNNKNFIPRASHAMATHNTTAYIFGGYYFQSSSLSNFVSYDFVTRNYTEIWSNNTPPERRYDHSLVYYKNQIYLFGGVKNNRTITNELWVFDLDHNSWTLLNPHQNYSDKVPKAVSGHSAHVIKDSMYVFFGYNPNEGYVHDIQVFHFQTMTWSLNEQQGNIFGRFGHSSSLYFRPSQSPLVFVYGGYNQAVQEAAYNINDELLSYDPDADTWTSLKPGGLRLFRHSSVIVDGQLIITGGNNHNESSVARGSECFSEHVLVYDIVCKQWTNHLTRYLKLAARYGHTSAAYNDDVYIFGGFDGMMKNDTLKLTLPGCDPNAQNEDECTINNNGARCVFINKNCTKAQSNVSYRQSFISLIKNESPRNIIAKCPGISRQTSQCSERKTCQDCFMQKSCGWCETTLNCVNSNTGCPDGSATTNDLKSCPAIDQAMSTVPTEKRECSLATNCYACRQLGYCAWFTMDHTRHTCISKADEAKFIQQRSRLQSERIAALTHIPTAIKSLTELRSSQIIDTDNATCPLPCAEHSDCQNCTLANCMWCPSTRRCVAMDTYMISFPYGQCQSWITQANSNHNKACLQDAYNCTLHKTCQECQSVGPRCGWCDDGSGTGLGTCYPGSPEGPFEAGQCKKKQWYYTDQPECQCNGHGSCDYKAPAVNGVKPCISCSNNTTGDRCEFCADGFFGNAENGGTCSACQCNDQSNQPLCDHETGDCFCTTKGVSGSHCDVCDPKYEGDPKNNKTCSYKLAIDFIFTFKLEKVEEKDKYINKINFFAIPYKADTDVQFSITCAESTTAVLAVKISTTAPDGTLRSKKLLVPTPCDVNGVKKTYKATDPEYPLGSEANTTYHVSVFNFTTPIKIQISFAQSPPINWVLFFVIFSACFVILLVIAGLVWIIKQRVERYQHMQSRHVEIERLASRPFASVQLDLSPNSYDGATPISVEPCSNYQAGIYTLIVRLPTGGEQYTPHGTSGLAVASSLCSLTQSQLALLQPPDADSSQTSQKSTFKRFISFKNPFSGNS